VYDKTVPVISRSLILRCRKCKISLKLLILQNFAAKYLVRNVGIGQVGSGETCHAFNFSLPPTRQQHLHLKFRKVTMILYKFSILWDKVFSCLKCGLVNLT